MEFLDGGDLGPHSYDEYGKMNSGYPAIIAAASAELAQEVRDYT